MIIVGKSCSGKSKLQERFTKFGLKSAILTTSRPQREDEVDGETYHFRSKFEMQIINDNDGFVDIQSYRQFDYALSYEEFNRSDVIILTPKNILSLGEQGFLDDSLVIYIETSHDIRYKRTLERASEYDDKNRRWVEDDEDFKDFNDYDMKLHIINEQALDELVKFIT